MTNRRNKLELTWVGKDERPRLEPRILLEDPSLSYHAARRVSEDDIFDNRLIRGDNLLALKALEQEFANKLKCVYIDPPYNIGAADALYEDGIEHSLWLTMMRDRLSILRNLLRADGAIFVQLDDEEVSYCRVLMDEIFGRRNFINQVCVKTKHAAGASGGGEDKRLKKNVEFLLVYVKDNDSERGFKRFNDVFEEVDLFELIDDMEAEGKSWKYTSVLLDRGEFVEERTVLDGGGQEISVKLYSGVKRTTVNRLSREDGGASREAVYHEHFDSIFSDTNAQTSIRARIIDEFKSLRDDQLLVASYVPRSGRDKGVRVEHFYISPTIRRVIWLKDSAHRTKGSIIKKEKLGTLWSGFNWNNVTKEGGVNFPHGKKPEALIQKVLELATEPGDLVLDSFAGSGTTGAVAQKMGRRWIMAEVREHCDTHIVPRLQRVIDGADQGGITQAVEWKGGGGFRYFRLGALP
jgi:adenine-specific DNA-methyltransferase